MAHAQKPDLVFQRNGLVHLNLVVASVPSTTGSQGVRISGSNGSNAGYTMFWGRVQDYWLPIPLACFPFTSPTLRHSVPSAAVMLDTPCSEEQCKTTGYPFHSHVSPSLPLPCVTVCHQVSTELYDITKTFVVAGSRLIKEGKTVSGNCIRKVHFT